MPVNATTQFVVIDVLAHPFRKFNSLITMWSIIAFACMVAWVHPLPTTSPMICKTTPESTNWPSKEAWTLLNDTLTGRLLQPPPPGAVCHRTQPTFASAECAKVQALWEGESFHSESPISVDWDNWVNDTCPPDPNLTCSPFGYPVYVINATTPEHVKIGIDFCMCR